MDKVIVKTPLGLILGEDSGNCRIFRGIPYAEAPVGELRFRRPLRKQPWEGVIEALEFGDICPQLLIKDGVYYRDFYHDEAFTPAMSEDCLYLNIWTPKGRGEEKYPVAMWIHGGGFDHGWGSEAEFDGEAFANKGVILVTINYRVGPFGFLALPELREEDPDGSTGNYGILDRIAALEWIKDNISSFGGDPERITVFGQSRGCISTQVLASTPLTGEFIKRAVLQSGVGLEGIPSPLEKAYRNGRKLMELVGAGDLEELRRMDADRLVEVTQALYRRTGGMAYRPVLDGYVMDRSLSEALEDGSIRDIPYMLGITANDISVEDGKYRESMFYKGAVHFAEERVRKGTRPVYMYVFDHPLPGDDLGAIHSWELWYVFGTFSRCWRPMEENDRRISEEMIGLWTSFMKSEDISGRWKEYGTEGNIKHFR